MNPQEVRIGNLFDFSPEGEGYLPVEEIRKDSNGFNGYYAVFRNGSFKCLVSEDGLRQIPLTKELLMCLGVLCGFYLDSEKRYEENVIAKYNEDDDEWHYVIETVSNCNTGGSMYITKPVEFLHEVQNLYFDMTGKDLIPAK